MKQKKLKLPHTLILIYAMVILTAAATWIVPGGEYQRVEKEGRSIPVDRSFQLTERNPQGLDALFVSPVKGFIDAAYIIAFLFVVGGAFAVIQKTGAITAFIHNLAVKFEKSRALRALLIPVTMIIFSVAGAVFGMCEETMPFILIFVPLSLSLGYDTIVGVAIPFVGAAAGFAGAFFNPFTVGIAQGIAGLPLYSGFAYRFLLWIVGTALAVLIVMRYASRIKKNPRLSPSFSDDEKKRKDLALDSGKKEMVTLSGAHKRVLLLFLVGMALLVFGILKYKWYINEIAGLFLALGILSGILGKLKGEEVAQSFGAGAKDMVNVALIIGCARAILVVATDGKILDTALFYIAKGISHFHPIISSQLMFISQCIINFFVHSGTAQAALTMPIMAPLGDLVGITRQTTVMAFQLAEYINPILPTSGVTMGVLGLARLRWEKWAKWFLPLMLIWVILGFLVLIPAVVTKWGPF
ncbi:MAG: putative basic amino acid antiporter YfcC [Candidatus Aminicenantes bacterium]|nr:putative basic amino acid antiporter YfcC [Candidatus Aminicenantes bacterium]